MAFIKEAFMDLKMHKWLGYTVAVGLMPIFCRWLAHFVSDGRGVDIIAASDIIAFGLILHISNINEMEHFKEDSKWKTWANVLAVICIAFYGMLTYAYIKGDEVTSLEKILDASLYITAATFVFSLVFSLRMAVSRSMEAANAVVEEV